MISMEELLALTEGYGRADFSIRAESPEARRRIENELLILKGRFAGLPAKQQDLCLWRQHAVAYWLMVSSQNPRCSTVWVDQTVAYRVGAHTQTLRRWRKTLYDKGVGIGYWHLFLQPAARTRGAGARIDAKALQIAFDGIYAGQRPSEIAKSIKGAGLKMSVEAIQRLRRDEEEAGRIGIKRFKNRFE